MKKSDTREPMLDMFIFETLQLIEQLEQDVLSCESSSQLDSSAINEIFRIGAQGLLAMRQKGAITIDQDEQSCVVYGMPRVAYEIGAVEKQVPLERIPQMVYSVLGRS